MQPRLSLGHLSLVLCLGCEGGAPRTAVPQLDAAAPDQARTGETDATPLPSTPGKEAGQPPNASTPKVDAGKVRVADGGRDGDGGAESAGDACSGACVPQSGACDDEHPCGAADTRCVDHVCTADPDAPPAAWARSPWSGRVGLVGDDDTTVWCTPALSGAGDEQTPATVTSQLDRVALDGTQRRATTASFAAQRVQLRCFADAAKTGPATLVTSAWSVDGQQDSVRARCPLAQPFGALAQCQLATEAKPPLVYAGPTCGDGTQRVAGKPAVRGQWIGDHYELSTPNKPLFNNTGKVAVMGSDLGFQFLAQGRMYVGFGDTWENEASFPAANGYRGNVLAYSHDFEPADDNGIVLEGWETAPDRPNVAVEVVRSPHDQSGNTEFTAIAASGFGLTEGKDAYRLLWFAAIKKWDPFTTNESTLAWSRNLGPFTRGDRSADTHPPRWPFDSHFGPGAIWVDREHGYVYFLGVRTYQPAQPVRLARVRATRASVLDHLQYEYWTGSAWQHPDAKDEYALARSADPAFDLIPGSAKQNTRPELSVAYNPYVGRYTLMLQNDATPFDDEAETYLELWEAEAIEGPWKRADTGDALVLPPHQYGPYLSEQTLSQGGRDVHFALSDWNLQPLTLGQPYVVALWNMTLDRRVRPGCAP
jgi:hypothetical protein